MGTPSPTAEQPDQPVKRASPDARCWPAAHYTGGDVESSSHRTSDALSCTVAALSPRISAAKRIGKWCQAQLSGGIQRLDSHSSEGQSHKHITPPPPAWRGSSFCLHPSEQQ
ncbi:hypothetical protein NQZ68_010373 [Dissostichus eleginoides]|nr:hypothetical protein NQZ68_010373 [Dissostichus eleginoides]